MAPARPFLKWAGGKSQLLQSFAEHYPTDFNRYFEPFIGGGAVFFDLTNKRESLRATISDSNGDLVNCYLTVRDHVETLIRRLKRYKNEPDYFYAVRARDSQKLDQIERAARVIYLNKTCFNGLYRVNRSGQFNVPFGKYKNPCIVNETNLRAVSEILRDVEIRRCSFDQIEPSIGRNDFIYLDPPYLPLSQTSSFTAYTDTAFNLSDQERLADFARAIDRQGAHFMLSNSDTPQIADLYSGFNLVRLYATRAINCKGSQRGPITELLIKNY